MEREEIKNKLFNYLKNLCDEATRSDPPKIPNFQLNYIDTTIFVEELKNLPIQTQQDKFRSFVKEIISEWITNGLLYIGPPGNSLDGFGFLTVTNYGLECLMNDQWLPYDPEGYVKALKEKVPNIDDITLAYIGESIAAYNRRQLLSATLTLGVASENLMLLLIEAYLNWIKDKKRKATFKNKIKDRFIYTQYKEFKLEFVNDIKNLPKELQGDWETYLDGMFNFIRLNRNRAGHPTGKKLNAKIVYANLQIFSEYTSYIFSLIKHFS